MLQQLQRQMESERIVEFDQLGRGDVAQRRIQPAGPAPSNRRPGHRSLPATTPGMGTFSVLLVTGTTGTTPRSRRIAAALALSLLTITAGRRMFAALPRADQVDLPDLTAQHLRRSLQTADCDGRPTLLACVQCCDVLGRQAHAWLHAAVLPM